MLVAIEGVAGGGKTALTGAIHDLYFQMGIDTCIVEEFAPAYLDGYISRARADDPYVDLHRHEFRGIAQTLLFASAHAYKYETLIRPGLLAGRIVLVDRFLDSLIIFQSAILADRGVMSRDDALEWVRECIKPLPKPDLVILVDPPESLVIQRRLSRGERITSFDTRFSRLIAEGYENQLALRPSGATFVVSNSENLTQVAQECLGFIEGKRGVARSTCPDS